MIQYRPENLSQMLKISGITPAAATILMIYLKNQGKTTQNENKFLDSATFGDFFEEKPSFPCEWKTYKITEPSEVLEEFKILICDCQQGYFE